MKKLRISITLILTLSLLVSASKTVWADGGEKTTFTLRVESAAYDNIVPLLFPTRQTFTLPSPVSALDALLYAADMNEYAVKVNQTELGAVIEQIWYLGCDEGRQVWMYAVNNEKPLAYADQYILQDGDELVFYFMDWQRTQYAFFEEDALTDDEPPGALALILYTLDLEGNREPAADASVSFYHHEKRMSSRYGGFVTDENGRVLICLLEPAMRFELDYTGVWEVTAVKLDYDRMPLITPPYAEYVFEHTAHVTLPDFDRFRYPEGMSPFRCELGDETYYPLRIVAGELGAAVSWNAATSTVTLSYGINVLSFPTDAGFIRMVGDRVYVPAWFFTVFFNLSEHK
jgi:hypothetical protein